MQWHPLRSLAPAVAGLWLLASPAADAGPPFRIGVFFWHDSPNDAATFEGLRAGLAQAGVACEFVEHRADSSPDKAKAAFAALREAHCDLVVVLGTQAALLAKDELRTVPVLFAAVSDAVASGIVPDWSGSGSNLCGASNWIAPHNVLDVFRLAVPHLHRLGMLRSATSGVVSLAERTTMQQHLAEPGAPAIELVESVAANADDVATATERLVAEGVDAIWIPIDITIYQDLSAVRRGLRGQKVPLLTTAAAGVRSGAVVGAVVDYHLHGRRAAVLAQEVLVRGRRPADLPIDRMHGIQVTVSLAAARRDGLELPLSLLALADELLDEEAADAHR